MSQSHVVVNLGKCPSRYPPDSSEALNAGVADLGSRLVPINAVSVRVCRYGSLDARFEGGGVLSSSVTPEFEDEANRLETEAIDGPSRFSEVAGCVGGPAYYVTFANAERKISLRGQECNYATNGVLEAAQTT